jgi:hypothetical protein
VDALAAPPTAADERAFHADLPELDSGALRLERHRFRLAVLFEQRPSRWVMERLERIEAEIEARRGR